MGLAVDSRVKILAPEFHCFRLNLKSRQLNTTHKLSNVTRVEALTGCQKPPKVEASINDKIREFASI